MFWAARRIRKKTKQMAAKPHIKVLFQRYLDNQCSPDDLDLLFGFFGTTKELELREMISEALFAEDHAAISSRQYEKKLQMIYQNLSNEMVEVNQKVAVPVLGSRSVWPRIAAAASIILCLSAAVFLILHKTPIKQQIVKNLPLRNDFLPGGNKAILTLATGQRIVLTGAQNGKLAQQGNAVIMKTADGKIVYNAADESAAVEVSYNTTSTPRGGQFLIVLADGTKVWLNAASSITYPTSFAGTNREVAITGEAYFEVAHNAAKPFRVKSNGQVIEVLGTHFNINAYTDEQVVTTTLFEGSVKVTKGTASAVLKPGQQSQVMEKGNNLNIKVVETVDEDQALAWKNGKFYFTDTTIEEVMRQVSRWYDVDIEYKGKIPNKRLSGSCYRNLTASKALAILEYTGINFKIEGRKIIVQ
ncbi:MAG: FecR family protein [Mucilaginibacter sp.]|nr:FecR family protein [Mucilaginibacter sp.]